MFGSAGAWDSDILSALSWVIGQTDTYDIAAVNLSLGSSPTPGCDAYYLYGELFGDLLAAGVAPVVAAGNDYVKSDIGAPACASSGSTSCSPLVSAASRTRYRRALRRACGGSGGHPFAAAFAARLNSRTFVSDSGLTMSATERYEPSAP